MRDEVEKNETRSAHKPERPKAATVAGTIWIASGGLNLLAAPVPLQIFLRAGFGGPGFTAFLAVVMHVTFGAALVYVGVQTVRWRARDTIGIGIGSIVLGLLCLHVAISQPSVRTHPMYLILSALLVLAGILALAGRSRYKAWRNAQMLKAANSG